VSENSVEKAVNAAFEAGRKAQAAGVVVDWEATGARMASALFEEMKKREVEHEETIDNIYLDMN
tara:strand:+ start:369 stop:560 length:192 start_codon:yes stop_codon:yes gene_type:complete